MTTATDTNETTQMEKYDSGLTDDKHLELANAFNPLMANVKRLIKTAEGVDITGPEDKAAMALARKTRLALKGIRVDVEKKRKTLKEESLRTGKAIDGMANIVKFLIVPVEEQLQEQEDYAKKIEQKRISDLVESRTQKLMAFDVDCSAFDLAKMNSPTFDGLLSASQLGHKAKLEAESKERKRIEEERAAKEKAEAERIEAERVERERIEAENAKLREEAAEREQKIEEERAKAQAEEEKKAAEIAKLEAEKREVEEQAAKLREQDQQRQRDEAARVAKKEQDDRYAELTRINAEKEAKQACLAAPDKDKLDVLLHAICDVTMPSVSSEVALDAVKLVTIKLNETVKHLRHAIEKIEEPTE